MLQQPLISELCATIHTSIDELKAQITEVQDAGIQFDPADREGGFSLISFRLDGKAYIGQLKGRNRKLILGFGLDADLAIACRALLDGDAQPQGRSEQQSE